MRTRRHTEEFPSERSRITHGHSAAVLHCPIDRPDVFSLSRAMDDLRLLQDTSLPERHGARFPMRLSMGPGLLQR